LKPIFGLSAATAPPTFWAEQLLFMVALMITFHNRPEMRAAELVAA
jgi:hypothetical protein